MKIITGFLLFMAIMGCREGKRYHDDTNAPISEAPGNFMEDVLAFQKAMNESFMDPETSPLPDRYRKDFRELDFFEPDTTFRVKARLERTPDAAPFLMPTTTGRQAREVLFGIAHFALQGTTYSLEVYRSADPANEGDEKLFLPFLDDTNGVTTYAGGRYLDLPVPDGETMVIDFNKAYNPYCVYNKKYSCPIVPRVNYLPVEVRAGVKDFEKP